RFASSRVYIEKAQITAPVTQLSPQTSGILEQLYVHEGDVVNKDALIARVGNELIKTKTDGEIVSVTNTIGALINRGTVIASMVRSEDLRVDGHVQENSGLRDIHVGQIALFTVDAFGSKQYTGVVDEVASTSRSGDIVFSISDKRAEQDFDVKVRFDTTQYPELKNGMSAKIWVIR
ncbi:MAG TPA: biotin/lipoyl-binding protein, partial [Candidatus Andersenbacteria bacterium]|nr:biotin/lipoyl-binding protein [Candidatus Andersenbacteria bacterium]